MANHMATLNHVLMKFRLFFLTFILFCFLIACASPATSISPTLEPSPIPQPLTGTWMGSAQTLDGTVNSIIINFDESTLQVEPFTKTWDISPSQTDSEIQISVEGKDRDSFQKIEFTGSFTNDTMLGSYGVPSDSLILTGNIVFDGQSSETIFLPIVSLAKDDYEKYEGVYRFDSGRALSIIVSPEFTASGLTFFSNTLMLTDFESGALRSLYPVTESTFYIGVKRDIGAPFDGRIEFVKDEAGNVIGLHQWQNPHEIFSSPEPAEYATRIEYKIEDGVSFISEDGTKLAGRLSLPISDKPVPAIMGLHGSEPGTRNNFGAKVMAHYMVSQGIAILNYDKRGVGESEGKYQEAASPANLQRHADDANAGVQYLLTRPEIDAEKIGLIGFSQAGWIIPLAASQSSDISFFVNLSGPVASFGQEDKFSAYTDDSYTAREYDDDIITQQLREMNPSGFNPLPIIAELNQKGLWLWGSVDKSVPTTFSAENLQTIIDSGKDNFSYQIFPNGDHNLNLSPNGYFSEIPYSPQVLFYSFLKQWLEQNIISQ